MTDICIFCYRSLALSYEAFNEMVLRGATVLEMSPIGTQGQIIAKMPKDAFEQFALKYKSNLVDAKYFEFLDSRILDAYLSLKISPIKSGLLIIESTKLSENVFLATKAVEQNLAIVDLRLFRGESPRSLLYVTAEQASDLQRLSELALKCHVSHVVLIEGPSKELIELFS